MEGKVVGSIPTRCISNLLTKKITGTFFQECFSYKIGGALWSKNVCARTCFDACRADGVVLLSTSSTKCGTIQWLHCHILCQTYFRFRFFFLFIFYLIKDAQWKESLGRTMLIMFYASLPEMFILLHVSKANIINTSISFMN